MNGDPELNTAIAALIIAVVAFITTVVQLAQTIIATAKGLPNCSKRVMGKWAKFTKRSFRWRELRLEIHFTAPVIFLARAENPKGPVEDEDIWYAEGTFDSCEKYRIEVPGPDNQSYERVHTVDNETASWLKLLSAVQKMEKDSRKWEDEQYHKSNVDVVRSKEALAVGIQAKKRSFDTNPAVKKPYATTTVCHIIELAAVLGLYWKEFDRDENKYRAEGNGYSLSGSRIGDIGLVFEFEKFGWPNFKETRILPIAELKEICFGNVPTFYRERSKVADDNWSKGPFTEQKTLKTLQLGSRQSISETLNLIGCNTSTRLYYLKKDKKHIHLFPGKSEPCH